MFATLKNKIKEETGDDVSTSTSQPHQRHLNNNTNNNNNNYRLRSRRISINSNFADDVGGGIYNEQSEQLCQLRGQCNELTSRVSSLSQSLQQLQEEKTRVDKTNEILLESVRVAQTQKDIYCEEQEKIQNLQQVEIDKLKNLMGFREQEAVDHMSSIRQYQQQIENLNQEMDRLRTIEPIAEDLRDELEQLRHATQHEKNQLTTTLAAVQEENRNLKMRMQIVEQSRLETLAKLSGDQQVQALVHEHKLLEQHLEETHLQLSDIKSSWSGQNFALEKQVSRLSQQVAEETTEKRKALKARDDAIESRKQVAFELEKAHIEIKQRNEKIKLLEDEVDELTVALKECREENEQQILFERNKSETLTAENKDLKMRIATADERFSEYVKNAEQIAQKLRTQITEKQDQLNESQTHLEIEREEKLTALLRNAEISQSEELLKKELRLEQNESNDLHDKNKQLENDVKEARVALQALNEAAQQNEKDLAKYEQSQREIIEKNKTIKTLSQRLGDLKKTLQKEFRSSQSATIDVDTDQVIPALRISHAPIESFQSDNKPNCIIMDEVNFKYLKHVIIKFLTSREVEARHLVRAVSTLLQLSQEEEKLLHDTLDYKMSWFGVKPS
ncbi:golgin subfamily A member 1 isoform X1 [Drosophila sulfurigaster albostrigata]|uniref:golgin subfamily A member 1 isoform X1 n=2 Tax=Drosophila sulfurigaster albostrigata TaxID=89887 RepID=UPI002D21E1DC|nr:golgin subfamily A member 1 isoform X1 [Drosophila sulfurigaster albostrigata]